MTKCAGLQADSVWAMPSARALLVASLLTEPPYGCLGPSGNDRYRKRPQTVWGGRETTTEGRLFKSGFEIPVHGANTIVAESGAWCNDLDGRCNKGELR
ncbi:hypothetical protein XH99_28740 [Bradyrhizobium nanningense]|uniref:Uncharacterized protein n=1 Tax=Bradyrhizobium nanningense TaxID=1325118 RepID=A0A4Q0RW00_9BRAD|nr:hypothetical protein XH99_28740 [Bradyrhizobium nanningense]